jgi:hypothetical protein
MNPEPEKLAALEAELRRDLEAIERVRRLMALKNGSLSPDSRQYTLPGAIAPGESDDGLESTNASSLSGTIERIVNSDATVRWTTPKMLVHLQQIGFPLRAKKPIYSIGQAMQKLASRGDIRIVRRGAGNSPNIYKGKVPTTEGEAHSANDVEGGMPPVIRGL